MGICLWWKEIREGFPEEAKLGLDLDVQVAAEQAECPGSGNSRCKCPGLRTQLP